MTGPLRKRTTIAPVFVLSTGRCGSTMVSNLLNRHPRVLSLSEFHTWAGGGAVYRRPLLTGDKMWNILSRPSDRARQLLQESFAELLYPVDDPGARFGRHDVPPLLCVALVHLTEGYEALFDELEPVVRGQARQQPADHIRYLFEWLSARLDREVWVERSGTSLLYADKLLRGFPEARFIHVYRDGRETALSMSLNPPFRLGVATLRELRRWGIDAMAAMSGERPLDRWLSSVLEPLASMLAPPKRLRTHEVTSADFGKFWSDLIVLADRALRPLPAERLLKVRFEDVQADPIGELGRLIRFIDTNLEDEKWLREACRIPRATPSRFARLGAGEQATLAAACRPGLERLGYPL